MNEKEHRDFLKALKQKSALSEKTAYLTPLSEGSIPRVDDNASFSDAKTSPVTPSALGDGPHARPFALDPLSGSSLGRGNDPERSAGSNIPPRVVGLELPSPVQVGGSNSPASSISQLPSATVQKPGNLSQERTYRDVSRSDAQASALVQRVPVTHLHAGTTPNQRFTITEEPRVSGTTGTRSDVVATDPADKDALKSHSIAKLSDDFVRAGVPRKKLTSIFVESEHEQGASE